MVNCPAPGPAMITGMHRASSRTGAPTAEPSSTSGSRGWSILPGLAIAVGLAVVATGLGRLAPIIGAPVVGIVLGVLASRRAARRDALRPGIGFAASTVLQCAVVVLGAQLSLRQIAAVGATSLPVMLTTVTVCLTLAYFLGDGSASSPTCGP